MENQPTIHERIDLKISQGFQRSFENFFDQVWTVFKKVTLPTAGAIILMAIPAMIIYTIMMPFLLGIHSFSQYMEIVQEDPMYFQEMQKSPVFLLKQSLFGLIVGIIFAPINAGFLKLCRDSDKTGETRFGTIFSFYKGKYLGPLMLVMVILTLVQNGLNIALSFIPIAGSFIYLILLVLMYVMIVYVQPLIIFADASIGDAFSLSFKLAGKTFLPVLGYGLLFGLLTGLGVLACCIGVLFTAAFMPAFNYVLYKQTVGFPEDDAELENTAHWQDQPPIQ